MDLAKTIIIYTDGACSGNPGKGGFGAVIVLPEGHVEELGEGRAHTTNNKMEMAAVIHALRYVESRQENIAVFTDSTYVIRGITQWIWGWQKNGWKTAAGEAVNNIDFWQALAELVHHKFKRKQISWHYVRGHTGNPGNERCDAIAVAFTKGKGTKLYSGSLLHYDIPVHDLPPTEELPEMKPNQEKKVAYSYLSYVNNQLRRHPTWKECEAVVKGRPGAKFKKAMSPAEELDIVKSWGLSASELAKINS